MFTRSSVARKAATALTLAMIAGGAMAESQYGYDSTGTGSAVTAQAKVNLKVTVPKLILLRVGSTNTTVDELAWTASLSIPAVPTTPSASANNVNVDWSGAAPTGSTSANPAALSVYAWTNSSGGGSLSYAATAFATGGPTLSAISVTAGAGLAHPTPTALAGTSTAPATFARNTLATGSWTYSLSGTGAAGWAAGSYTSTVTYTATSI